ncbi:MAG: NADH-quinone oxidoreductase subunit K, partial [Chloroflexota bacterium]
LPHVLTLTAIVVSVATAGVSLALLLTIYRRYGTLDEKQILEEAKQ